MRSELNLFTHDGQFHADEVFATAMFSLIAEKINVVRGGDADLPEDPSGWIIYDIGGGELDHHTPENKENNGTHPGTNVPYAACGLVWRKYYTEILEELDCPERYMDRVYSRIEHSLIIGIDAKDNEYNPLADALDQIPNITDEQRKMVLKEARGGMTITDMIKDFNPTWNSDLDPYECFMDAVGFAKDILLNRIDSVISSLDSRDFVMRAIDFSANHIMLMDQFAPWEGVVYGQKNNPKANDIWYAVYPALRGGWNIQCARVSSDDRNTFRHPLPAAWYGLRGEELQNVTGVKGAQFCHVSGFLCGADSQEDALELIRLAMQ